MNAGGAKMVFAKLCYLITLLACVVAGVLFLGSFAAASAPQEAAAASMAVAAAAIPYIFSRAVEGLAKRDAAQEIRELRAEMAKWTIAAGNVEK